MNAHTPDKDATDAAQRVEMARRKRLIYRANYRGFREADLLLGGFAKRHMNELSDDQVLQFEALLGAKDHDIYAWITGRAAVPAEYDTPILARLRAFDPLK
jgi:antitoxin CptB